MDISFNGKVLRISEIDTASGIYPNNIYDEDLVLFGTQVGGYDTDDINIERTIQYWIEDDHLVLDFDLSYNGATEGYGGFASPHDQASSMECANWGAWPSTKEEIKKIVARQIERKHEEIRLATEFMLKIDLAKVTEHNNRSTLADVNNRSKAWDISDKNEDEDE